MLQETASGIPTKEVVAMNKYRSLAALAALLMLTALAHAQTMGRTTAGTIPSGGLRADFSRGSKFAPLTDVTVTELCAYLDGKGGGSGSQSVRLVIYRDANGIPTTKVGESASVSIAAGAAASWKCLETPYLPLAYSGGNYWIMVQSGSNTGVVRYYYDGPANWYGAADTFADGAAPTFGPGGTGQGTLSVYASLGNFYNVGATTVGTTPSGGLRADYKRGSPYPQEGGRALALSAYMDGLGGGTGAYQDVTFVTYQADAYTPTDAPGERALVSRTVRIPAGMQPQWVTVRLPPYETYGTGEIPIQYWFVIHSGSNAGIARYYHDGTGSWCGHADTFADGPSLNFGSCDAGNGALSAFLSFESGKFGADGIIGNSADPSTAKPSGGLSANFIRGSKFTVTKERAAINSVHAYLDGLGGSAGSQQVQVLVYDDSPGHKLIAQSVVDTVTAGTQPAWRNFQLKEPVYVPPGNYYLMLFTSGTAGVARNYATSPPNWLGIGATFSAGPPAILDPPPADAAAGDVTLLMYADLIVPIDQPFPP
jgi:hypothetical protein